MEPIVETLVEKLLGSKSRDLLEGEKPTRKDIILLDENLKKLNPTLRGEHERIKQMIPHLQNNLSSWNQDLQYKLLCGETIRKRVSRLLLSAKKLSYPKASKVKVNDFHQSLGDLFEFYERAESEAPESELGPVLCSKTSGGSSLSLW